MTKTCNADASMQMKVYEYSVVGRKTPTERDAEPEVFRMRIFARDEIVAKSRFWYFMKRLQRVKKANGEILECKRVQQKNVNTVKNFGIWLRYDTRTGTVNMYKEFRAMTSEAAVAAMYNEMAGRHRAASCSIQILDIKEIADGDCRRNNILQLHDAELKFPHIRRSPMCPKFLKKTFVAQRAKTFFN